MKFLPFFCALLLAATPLFADDPTLQTNGETVMDSTPSVTPIPSVPNDNTVLTFEDKFTTGTLDDSKWNRWYPWPVIINHEMQNYVLDAFDFSSGGLRIRCDERPFLGQKFSSGAMTTNAKFLQAYGYFEMTAKIPKGNGFWPAFWIMPPEEAKSGGAEIDVMENLGQDPNTVHLTLHSSDPVTKKPAGKGEAYKGPDYSADYHTYAVSWRPKDLVWLVDGVERFHIAGTVVPSVPEYMLVNLAIGGAWPVRPDATTPLPGYLDIKSIRVYQYKDLPPVTVPHYTVGKTTVSAATLHPGDTQTMQLSVNAGSADVPPLLARLYVTDFYGKKYLNESDIDVPAISAGSSAPLTGQYVIPADLAPGVYTVAAKFECATDPTLGSFVGCLYRFTVVAK